MDTLFTYFVTAATAVTIGLAYLLFKPSQTPVKLLCITLGVAAGTIPLWNIPNITSVAVLALFGVYGLLFSLHDLETMTIPVLPWFVLSPFVIATAAAASLHQGHSAAFVILALVVALIPVALFAVVGVAFRLLRKQEGIGAGDYMLIPTFCAVPALLSGDLATIFYAFVAATATNLVAAVILVRGKRNTEYPAVPGLFIGPFLLAAAAVIGL